MASAVLNWRLPSQPQGITAFWSMQNRGTCVNNLPKVVNWKRNSRESYWWPLESQLQRPNHTPSESDHLPYLSSSCICEQYTQYKDQTITSDDDDVDAAAAAAGGISWTWWSWCCRWSASSSRRSSPASFPSTRPSSASCASWELREVSAMPAVFIIFIHRTDGSTVLHQVYVEPSLLRRLSTWRYPHLLLSAGACRRSIDSW